MKKLLALILLCVCLIGLTGCRKKVEPVDVVYGNMKTYFEMADGTWNFEGNTYKYRLEITGRMNNAATDSTFVYLSNLEEITFDQAWKAAGFSSISTDYFDIKDAVLVEMK